MKTRPIIKERYMCLYLSVMGLIGHPEVSVREWAIKQANKLLKKRNEKRRSCRELLRARKRETKFGLQSA